MKKATIFLVLFFIFNIVCATPTDSTTATKELHSGQSKLINPLIDCYDLHHSTLRTMMDLEDSINHYVQQTISTNKNSTISVYYRDLKNGPWIGINEDQPYSPASLLKVPYLIAALKQAEEDPSFLSKKITYYPQEIMPQNITADCFSLKKDSSYTIEQLLNYMIIYSDNASKDIIVQNLWSDLYENVFYDLGIDINKYNAEDNFLSVKEYATYYRMLYKATYLNKKMSNLSLEILTKSKFNKGITAELPKGTIVAHKFGERSIAETNLKQLHDCGIVYKENNPYLICIMAKGTNFIKLEKIIAHISAIIYYH